MRFVHWLVQSLLRSFKFPGRDFLIEQLPKWFLKKASGPTIIQTRFGFKIEVDPTFDLNIEKPIYERGVYELGTVDFIQNNLEPGDFYIDVGANIGFLSLVAAAKVGPKGEVYSFEPVPSTYEILSKNIDMNVGLQIKAEPYALGNETGEVTIYPELNNRGGASINIQRAETGIAIPIKRLDNVVLSKKVKMIKVDVEGHEWDVLKGGEQLIRKDVPILIVEFSRDRETEGDAMEMFRWLKEMKLYEFYRFKNGKERSASLVKIISKTGGLPRHDNIICLPKIN